VVAIDEAAIRELATIRGERAPITSCYLDVDGRRVARYRDLEYEVELLLRDARVRADGHPSVRLDLAHIERFVKEGIDRSRTRGVAIFACAAQDLWQVVELPVRFHPQVLIHSAPAVGQLEAVVRQYEPIGVLAVDRQRARMFVFALGELVEHSERFQALPREEGARGERDRGADHAQHLEERVHQHLRNACQVAFDVWQQHGFAHLVIAAPEALAGAVESYLHPYLAERLAGRLAAPVGAKHEDILVEALEMEAAVERRRAAAIVDKLRAAASTGRRAVAGLEPVLDTLAEHRVEALVVSQGFSRPGWRCGRCGLHAVVGRTCKRCHGEMTEIEDVVEGAVEEALAQSCRVEICAGNADLDVMGRIGALLRY
jgi:peptide chain release factor subunit 1